MAHRQVAIPSCCRQICATGRSVWKRRGNSMDIAAMSEPHDLHDQALRDRAVRAARGQEPFDVLLTGADVADVATGEIRAADVGLVGPLIASVHPAGSRNDARECVAL